MEPRPTELKRWRSSEAGESHQVMPFRGRRKKPTVFWLACGRSALHRSLDVWCRDDLPGRDPEDDAHQPLARETVLHSGAD